MLAPRAAIQHLFCAARCQVVTEYKESELDVVLGALERMTQNLTAAVVSNDALFQQKVHPVRARP